MEVAAVEWTRRFYSLETWEFLYKTLLNAEMKQFLDENFLLQSETAQQLYHEFAKDMPMIDYHCHLPPDQIADDIHFENLTQDMAVWRSL